MDLPVSAAVRMEILLRFQCSPLFIVPGWNAHKLAEIGIDAFQADRSPDSSYVTPGLAGYGHMKGGFYHDRRFTTLKDVVNPLQ
ncbi:MAG: hypothetical protein ABIQ74_12760 [Chitinophagales bacterium]